MAGLVGGGGGVTVETGVYPQVASREQMVDSIGYGTSAGNECNLN